MDAVVYLALFVLTAVFVVSLVVLVVMCRRRSFRLRALRANPSFSKLRNENHETLIQLTPLLSMALERNGWVYDVGGILQHCVAVLQLAHSLSEQLSKHNMAHSSPQLQMLVCEATQRIMPRFDDLLTSVASPKVDVRVLESRAMALATVCWSLAMPFNLAHPSLKDKIAEPLLSMEQHLEALRVAAKLAERSDGGKVDIDWTKARNDANDGNPDADGKSAAPSAIGNSQQSISTEEDDDDDDDDDNEPTQTTAIIQTKPITESSPLVRESASPGAHPADPVA